MSKRLTDEELRAIRERVEKATEGPWRIGKQSPNGLNNIGTVGGLLTAQTTNEANAAFIAHARQDIPKLLAEIERLREFEERVTSPLNIQGIAEDGTIVKLKNVVLDFGGDCDE